MPSAKTGEFGLSFLDVLSCTLGGMIILFTIFAVFDHAGRVSEPRTAHRVPGNPGDENMDSGSSMPLVIVFRCVGQVPEDMNITCEGATVEISTVTHRNVDAESDELVDICVELSGVKDDTYVLGVHGLFFRLSRSLK